MVWYERLSARTAIARSKPSKPLELLLKRSLIPKGATVLDYGCGKGVDVKHLRSLGFEAYGYDPHQPGWDDPSVLNRKYDVVLNFYVLNVLPPESRERVLEGIKSVLKDGGVAFIAVRDISEPKPKGEPYADGIITSRGTFQKFFEPFEFERLLRKYFRQVRIISYRQPLLAEVRK